MPEQSLRYSGWRPIRPHKPLFDVEEPVQATRFFDQLSFIGTTNVCCFVLETSEGLIQIDCMEPLEKHRDLIVEGYKQLGLDMNDLKAILITHGHGDHYGMSDWFRQQTGCTVYMSKIDYEFAQHDTRNRTGVLKWEINDYLEDGGSFRLGDTEVRTFWTPGHTPGCMSFVFPVTDEGRPHMVALWGGTGVPWTMSDKVDYLNSTLKFAKITEELGVDAEISNHPFVDKLCERLEIVRSICDGVPNPFVLGKDRYKYYERMFTDMCIDRMRQQAAEADKLLPPQPERLRPRKNEGKE